MIPKIALLHFCSISGGLYDLCGTFGPRSTIKQPAGYRAFIPAPLPPDPPLRMDALLVLLSEAEQALGRLDELTEIVPNADLFVGM